MAAKKKGGPKAKPKAKKAESTAKEKLAAMKEEELVAPAPEPEPAPVPEPEPEPEVEPVVLSPEPIPEEAPKVDVPVMIPLEKDTEAFVPAIALVDGRRRIGPNTYILNLDQEIAGGVLECHMPMLEEHGQAKRK